VLKVLSDILLGIDSADLSALVLLDLSAAFDKVDYHILLQRLERSYGITGSVHQSFQSVRTSGGARGHPDRGSSFPDRGAEVSAGSTLPCKLSPPPPTSSHYIYCEVEAQLTSCMHMSRN